MKTLGYTVGLLLLLLSACTLNSSSVLVDLGLITPTPTPDPYRHYRSSLQPWAGMDIEKLPSLIRYHITARLNSEQIALEGVARITIPTPPEALTIRLYPNLANYGGQMTISQAEINGTPVNVTPVADGTAIRLPSPAPSDQASLEPAVVELAFTTTLPGTRGQDDSNFTLFGWDGPILSLPGFFPTLAVRQDNEWVLDQPPPHGDVLFNEVALYQLDLTLPGDMVVAAGGVTLNTIDNPDGSRTWQIVGGPLRDMSVVAGPFQTVSETAAGAVVKVFYLPEHEAAGRAVLAHAAASLRLYSELYGTYPYTELDVV
ncbi:MAG: hypothetical protein R3264_20450, partial [Anaerolineae bacterium]|nr:hypothetical protein [Anaerolineae bacterium]